MLQVNDIFGIFTACIENLGASAYLEGWILFEHHLILSKIPLCWQSKSSVRLFDTTESCNFLVKVLYIILSFLNRLSIRSLSISFEQSNVLFTERNAIVLLFVIFLAISTFLIIFGCISCTVR